MQILFILGVDDDAVVTKSCYC